MLEIKVKYFNKNLKKIEKINQGDWIDLRACSIKNPYTKDVTSLEKENLKIQNGTFTLIGLGIAIELPKGYEAHIIPRSSTYKNFSILQTNSMGVIDESYKGDNDEWFVPTFFVENQVINFNDRICQFRIMKKMPEIKITEVEILGNDDRGGHGSTGIK